ncbi:MAG: T9SS type A sorting domain-containing protein [Bacteroidia bacterium]|jgi:hypothetical protein|nr:T9SS type A sorting domain-containing protein [Bacteroidia bacterium]
MKKIYFLSLIAASFAVNAQVPQTPAAPGATSQGTTKNEVLTDQNQTVVGNKVKVVTPPLNKKAGRAINDQVGTTFVINQTNGAPYRRIIYYPDGKISLTWTASTDNGVNGFLSRGSGYNHFNGNSWISTPNGLRLEAFRAGFPALANTNDKEIIMSHRVDTSGRSGGLVFNTNASIGSNTWTSNTVFTPPANTTSQLWPRTAISGNYLIVVANYQDSSNNQPNFVVKNGVRAPMVYSRYDLTTNQWVDQDRTLPGYDNNLLQEGSTDNYSIDANGNNVAIVMGGVFTSLVLWKSSDNGANWTRTVLDTFDSQYVFDKDTILQRTVNNGSVHVMLDPNGKAHVWSGMARISDSITNDASYTFSWARGIGGVNDGIIYWNENLADSGLRIIATAIGPTVNDSAIGNSSFDAANRYGISNSTWPSAGIDASGRIFVVYSSLIPTDDNGQGVNFRDLLVTYSSDNGLTWSYPVNLTSWISFNREEVYPTMAKFVGTNLVVTYLNKSTPGSQVANDNQEVFGIYSLSIPVDQILNNKVGLIERSNDLFEINQNYPNPFKGTTTIPVLLKRSTDVTISVTNLMGQTIYTRSYENNATGINQFEVSLPQAEAGIYFYTVEAGDYKVTRKMIIE